MLMLKTLPAAKGSRNMKARLEPFSRSLCKRKGKFELRLHRNFEDSWHSWEGTGVMLLVGVAGGNQGSILALRGKRIFFSMSHV